MKKSNTKNSKKIRIAINGFGRIGRAAFKIAIENPNLEIVAINDLTDNITLAHLLKYDSVYGVYDKDVKSDNKNLIVDSIKYPVYAITDPLKLPWKTLDIDVVLECTGRFADLESAKKHLKAGSKKVIISSNSKTETVPHIIFGINEEIYNPMKDNVVSACSCTTNCLSPIVKIINDNFKIKKGFLSTIHSYTTSQNLLDMPHKNLRESRAAALNIIPSDTGAAKAVTRVIPKLKGK
ncbi:type I glyceraldehyde-3-phosphate dehydrogenase, partial [Patescibacteria group bacterium]